MNEVKINDQQLPIFIATTHRNPTYQLRLQHFLTRHRLKPGTFITHTVVASLYTSIDCCFNIPASSEPLLQSIAGTIKAILQLYQRVIVGGDCHLATISTNDIILFHSFCKFDKPDQ